MKRVLVFNFFAGVIERGIPLYTQNLAECMRRVGIEPVEMRCPVWLRRLPRPARNVAFVLFEQIVAPLWGMLRGCSLAVYPYNSLSVVDSLLGRAVLVVHDLIPNRRHNLAARYICVTQTIHRWIGGRICAASEHTLTHLRRLGAFKRCTLALWSNPFYSFQAAHAWRTVSPRESGGAPRILLCSGMGRYKDYSGALRLFARSAVLRNAELRVMGFGDDAALAMRRVKRLPPEIRDRVTVLPRLSLADLINEYVSSDVVWVHSKKEGFGRCVVEGRLSGRPVVASDIGAFRKFTAFGVHLYRNDTFDSLVARALEHGPRFCLSATAYHAPLEAAVSEVVGAHSAAIGLPQTADTELQGRPG
jgi:glycosyltransferase involved in cell wall biosynthesis